MLKESRIEVEDLEDGPYALAATTLPGSPTSADALREAGLKVSGLLRTYLLDGEGVEILRAVRQPDLRRQALVVGPAGSTHSLPIRLGGRQIEAMIRRTERTTDQDIEALRRLSPERKLAVMHALIRHAYELKAAGIRAREPELPEDEVESRARLLVGGEIPDNGL